MDNLNSRCNSVTEEYKQKYDKLLSLVNGYEIANNNQNESMKSLANIINNTKELISESEFETLKNEQQAIMKDFAKLEEMKQDPYSNETLEFSKNIHKNLPSNEEKKPKYGMETLIEEEENDEKNKENLKSKKEKKLKYGVETSIEENENNSQNRENVNLKTKKPGTNILEEEIKSQFSLDSLNNLKKKKYVSNKKTITTTK